MEDSKQLDTDGKEEGASRIQNISTQMGRGVEDSKHLDTDGKGERGVEDF